MYSKYFLDLEVNPEFDKEFISLFDGWLGKDNLHKLDEVTENEWRGFNALIKLISENYDVAQADCGSQSICDIGDINEVISTYREAMDKDSSQFTKLVIPALGCVLTEDWDYTYILWHKENGALEALTPLINKAGLYHFHD